MRVALGLLGVACSACSAPSRPARDPVDEPVVPPPSTPQPAFHEIELATDDGLSGLAVDAGGALWTIAERTNRAYRIEIGPSAIPAIAPLAIEGVPDGLDLEGIAWLGGDRFALGTEAQQRGSATVLLAVREGDKLRVTSTIELPSDRVGMELAPNNGAEGVCGRGDTIVVAIEGAVVEEQTKRWAPVVRVERGAIAATYRLWLTSPTGKLAALDCTLDGDRRVWAIERHFEVTRVLAFELPASDRGDITPTVALDLGPTLQGRINLEGIARGQDGTTFAVVDNQWKTIQGPNKLLVFAAGAIR